MMGLQRLGVQADLHHTTNYTVPLGEMLDLTHFAMERKTEKLLQGPRSEHQFIRCQITLYLRRKVGLHTLDDDLTAIWLLLWAPWPEPELGWTWDHKCISVRNTLYSWPKIRLPLNLKWTKRKIKHVLGQVPGIHLAGTMLHRISTWNWDFHSISNKKYRKQCFLENQRPGSQGKPQALEHFLSKEQAPVCC